jgi:exonuclease III
VTKGKESEFRESKFSTDFLNKGWKWSSDPSTPTNRKLNKVYDEKTSYTSVIDFFLISPNINSLSVKTIDTFFEFSDHQPVKMEFSLD